MYAVVYLGFYFWEGSKYFCKSGGVCMLRAMQRVAKCGGGGGSWVCSPDNYFGEYFAKIW